MSSAIFIAFLDKISNCKILEANLQNSSVRPVESYWTSSRIQWTSNRSSTGRPLDQMIWVYVCAYLLIMYQYIPRYVIQAKNKQHIFTHVFITKYMHYMVSNFEKEVAIYFHIFFEEDFLSFPLSFQALHVFQSSKFSLAKQLAFKYIYIIFLVKYIQVWHSQRGVQPTSPTMPFFHYS